MILITNTLAQLTVCDQDLLFLADDEVLIDLLMCQVCLSATFVVHTFLLCQIFFKVQEVSHLDSVIDRDLEADHRLVQVLGDAEVYVFEAGVDHQEIKVGLSNVIFRV
jgi:hypothetical protein